MRRSNRTSVETPRETCRDEIHREATVEWMVADVAERCRAVLDALAHPSYTSVHLGSTAMLLRGAADDLVSMVELVESPARSEGERAQSERSSVPGSVAFGLAFDQMLRGGATGHSLSDG